MILLDTNIVSEVMRTEPALNVIDWLNEQTSSALYVSSVTIGEIAYGLRILPSGKRRSKLRDRFERFISEGFAQRVLAYDEVAARTYGDIMGARREEGRPMSMSDGQIAAIAQSNHLAVATRNTADFEGCGIELFNPFTLE